MRKICHIVQSYYPRDPRIRRQAEALVEAGYYVDVVCLRAKDESPRETINGVNVLRLPLTRKRGSILRYLFEYIAFCIMAWFYMLFSIPKHYQLVHVSNLPDFLVFSSMPAKWFGGKILLDEHDPMPELFMSKYRVKNDSFVIKYLKWQEKLSLHFAHRVLTVNDAMKQRFDLLADPVQVSVVMNLPDDMLFKSVHANNNQLVAKNEFVLLYTGTVSKVYDLGMVVEAVSELKSQIPNIRLKIVGEGDDIPYIVDLANKLNISDIVELCGVVPFNEIPEIISTSDIGLSTLKLDMLTDLCFNNKTAEYVMMGLPSVVTRTRTVENHFPEGVVRFFEAGNMESFKEAVLELYKNPQLRKEMSIRGMEFSKTANWSTEKKKYVELIEELCSK